MSNTTLQVLQPAEYFRDKVSSAVDRLQVEMSDEIEFYLVNLLCEFIAPDRLNDIEAEVDVLETPLAVIFKKALESPPERQAKLFKRMGDTSLYVAGCFQDYFNRKTFDIDYYIAMGKNAYLNLSSIMWDRHRDEHFSAMYDRLGQKFPEFVEVFAMVAEDTPIAANDADILSLYERWNSTKSERLRKKLAQNGIQPILINKKAQ